MAELADCARRFQSDHTVPRGKDDGDVMDIFFRLAMPMVKECKAAANWTHALPETLAKFFAACGMRNSLHDRMRHSQVLYVSQQVLKCARKYVADKTKKQ